jgi:hypothetical protein
VKLQRWPSPPPGSRPVGCPCPAAPVCQGPAVKRGVQAEGCCQCEGHLEIHTCQGLRIREDLTQITYLSWVHAHCCLKCGRDRCQSSRVQVSCSTIDACHFLCWKCWKCGLTPLLCQGPLRPLTGPSPRGPVGMHMKTRSDTEPHDQTCPEHCPT